MKAAGIAQHLATFYLSESGVEATRFFSEPVHSTFWVHFSYPYLSTFSARLLNDVRPNLEQIDPVLREV